MGYVENKTGVQQRERGWCSGNIDDETDYISNTSRTKDRTKNKRKEKRNQKRKIKKKWRVPANPFEFKFDHFLYTTDYHL